MIPSANALPDGANPCRCGATPTFTESDHLFVTILRLVCPCGRRGAALLFTKREDRERMKQAAVDGWNLAD